MIDEDVLAPNRRQAINNNRAEYSMIKEYHSGTKIVLRNIHIVL